MGKIFYIMGKSSSGKDTIYNTLVKDKKLALGTITGYTTRPMRENEMEGREYHFVSEKAMEELENQGKIVEKRCYNTVYGPWYYFTVDDGQIDLDTNNYILIGTLESYNKVRKYYQKENVIPVYIEVEHGERLIRAINREKQQDTPKYEEMCRRFIADSSDFSEKNIKDAEINNRYINNNLSDCLRKIEEDIVKFM